MTPEIRKAFNTYMGILLILLSLICFGFTGFLIFKPADPKEATVMIEPVSKKPCLEALGKLGVNITDMGEKIRVQDFSDAPPFEKLQKASLGISMCHFYLESFCMGQACNEPGVTYVITQKENGK